MEVCGRELQLEQTFLKSDRNSSRNDFQHDWTLQWDLHHYVELWPVLLCLLSTKSDQGVRCVHSQVLRCIACVHFFLPDINVDFWFLF